MPLSICYTIDYVYIVATYKSTEYYSFFFCCCMYKDTVTKKKKCLKTYQCHAFTCACVYGHVSTICHGKAT